MLQLFLSKPSTGDNQDEESYMWRKSLLEELELAIWSILSSAGRSEARLWLCSTLSGISSISRRRQQDLFVRLLRSKPVKRLLASQVLQLIIEKQPDKLGPFIAEKSYKLENFFKGNPKRILDWFSKFSGTDDIEHGKGAKALSQFAFVNRDICWEELEWKGKHGQSPAMVATKPHYFLDLDVQRTVENFLEYVPDFWSSKEFSESLKDGAILLIDTKYFVDMFIDLMYKEDLEEVWDVVEEFFMQQSFSFLCHHLLIILEEQDLCLFLNLMPKHLKPSAESIGFDTTSSHWLEIILSKHSDPVDIDQLMLLNAVTNQGRRLLRLVQEEGSEEEKEKIKNLMVRLCASSSCTNDLALIVERDPKQKPLELIKLLGLQSWAIHVRLLEEFRSPESWENLFISNGIKFRKSERYALLTDDEFSKDLGSDYGGRSTEKTKQHKKHKKKRKRNLESYEDELDDFDLSHTRVDLQSKSGDWLLSTDGYSTTWSSTLTTRQKFSSELKPSSSNELYENLPSGAYNLKKLRVSLLVVSNINGGIPLFPKVYSKARDPSVTALLIAQQHPHLRT